MQKLKEPITLAEKARYYRTLAKRSLDKQKTMYEVYNKEPNVKLKEEIHNESRHYSKMVYEAETNEMILRLAKESREAKINTNK
jgi:hypothetical protein